MNPVKKAFLYFVGAVAIAYEETVKVVKEQSKKLDKQVHKAKAA